MKRFLLAPAVWLAALLFVIGGLLTGQTPVEFGRGVRDGLLRRGAV